MTDKISLADGKYMVQHENGVLTATRYGEPWRDMTGDNLIFYLVMRVLELEQKIEDIHYGQAMQESHRD